MRSRGTSWLDRVVEIAPRPVARLERVRELSRAWARQTRGALESGAYLAPRRGRARRHAHERAYGHECDVTVPSHSSGLPGLSAGSILDISTLQPVCPSSSGLPAGPGARRALSGMPVARSRSVDDLASGTWTICSQPSHVWLRSVWVQLCRPGNDSKRTRSSSRLARARPGLALAVALHDAVAELTATGPAPI